MNDSTRAVLHEVMVSIFIWCYRSHKISFYDIARLLKILAAWFNYSKPQAFFRSNLARLTKCIVKVNNLVTIKVSDIICFVLAHWIPEYQTLLIDDVFF